VLKLAAGKFEGKPFHLEPSQKFKTGSLFGWKTADGNRRFRRAYIEEGKGNGKSPWAAGIGMYLMLADGEPRAEIYAAASQKTQAAILFKAAVAMVQQSPALSKRLTPSGVNPVWNLADLKSGSFFRPISTDEAHSGPLPSGALCDEIHEHRDGRVIEMLERGFKSRRQPLLVMITNSGSDRTSVCWQEHEHAVRVAAGTMTPDDEFTFVGEAIDDTTFSFVCALDKGDDFLEDRACWEKANPLLGVSMPVEELERAVAQAKAIPGKLNNILRLHGCVWTDAETAWMSRPTIDAVLADFDPLDHSGDRLMAGVDLSASQDLTAVAFIVETGSVDLPDDKGGVVNRPTYDAWVEAWTPGDTALERSKRDNVPYDLWIAQGLLNAPPGRLIRMDFIAARIAEVQSEYQLSAIAYDAYAFRRNFEPELDKLGVTVPLLEHPQGGKRRAQPTDEQIEAAKAQGKEAEGLWMPGSLSALEAMILEKRIRIRRSPVIVSAIMGATIEEDAFGNRWFSKRKATTRIDPLVALAMAVGAATSAASKAARAKPRVYFI
jgi:phage terminase large subunit-like protein